MYSEKAKRLIKELPNCGELEDPTHEARVVNPVCGDEMQLFLKVEDEAVVGVRYKVRGCPAAMAAAAGLSLLLQDATIDECLELKSDTLSAFLGQLPSHKKHAVELAIRVLRQALMSGESAGILTS